MAAASPTCTRACTACTHCRRACARCAAPPPPKSPVPGSRSATASAACSPPPARSSCRMTRHNGRYARGIVVVSHSCLKLHHRVRSGYQGSCFVGTSFELTVIRRLKLHLFPSLVLAVLLVGLCRAALGQGNADLEAPGLAPFPATLAGGTVTLFQNVRIFDGKNGALSAPSDVLIRGNIIERISASPITVDAVPNVRIIAANGRVLMPGLIDAHWHAFMAA